MGKELFIDDKVAMSIRGLWHIQSMDEKKKLIARYDKIGQLFLALKNHPEKLSKDHKEYITNLRKNISEDDEKIVREVFLALHLGIVGDLPNFTVDEIKELYQDGLYFAKEELEELIDWELYRPDGKHNPELFILLSDYLNKGLFFNTIEEAEKAMDDYENTKDKEVNNNALTYLTSFISRTFSKRISF